MDMKRSDLPLLLSLDALLNELNVTRAAARMHVSQSTLSGHLARLREIFGDPLLVPSENGRGMVATERARELQPRLAQALSLLRDAVAEPSEFDPVSSGRTFVIAANDGIFTILGLDVMTEVMRHANPALRMAVVPATDLNLVDRMAKGEIDVVLGDVERMPEQLKSRYLLTADFALAQRKGHPRGLRAPSMDEYCALAHVVVSPRADFSTPIDELLLTLGRTRHIAATVPNYSQVALILSASDGVATLPRRLLERYGGLIDLLDLPFEIPPFRLAMGWHPRAQQDKAAAWLRGCFPTEQTVWGE